jgi:hypothetical protein
MRKFASLRPALDLGHDPARNQSYDKRNGLGDKQKLCWNLRTRLWRLASRGPQPVADEVDGKGERRKNCGEDEQAPSCTEPICADKNIMQS